MRHKNWKVLQWYQNVSWCDKKDEKYKKKRQKRKHTKKKEDKRLINVEPQVAGISTRACRVSASHAKGKVKGILSMVRGFESYIIHGKGWYSWVIYFRLLSVPLLFYGWSMIILCTLVWLIQKEYWVTLPTWYQTLLTINPCCLTNCTFGNKPCDKHSFLFPSRKDF